MYSQHGCIVRTFHILSTKQQNMTNDSLFTCKVSEQNHLNQMFIQINNKHHAMMSFSLRTCIQICFLATFFFSFALHEF